RDDVGDLGAARPGPLAPRGEHDANGIRSHRGDVAETTLGALREPSVGVVHPAQHELVAVDVMDFAVLHVKPRRLAAAVRATAAPGCGRSASPTRAVGVRRAAGAAHGRIAARAGGPRVASEAVGPAHGRTAARAGGPRVATDSVDAARCQAPARANGSPAAPGAIGPAGLTGGHATHGEPAAGRSPSDSRGVGA